VQMWVVEDFQHIAQRRRRNAELFAQRADLFPRLMACPIADPLRDLVDLLDPSMQMTQRVIRREIGAAPGYQMVCVPEQVRQNPRTIVEAQFSVPYAVAATWIDGTLGMSHFTEEGLRRGDILELTARVHPYVDEEMNREWSRVVTPAKLTVQFSDGQTVETRVDYPKGHPRNPMSEAEFAAKTADCVTFAARPLAPDTAVRLIATAGRLEAVTDIAELMRVMI
jgi:hypothetical protein